MILWGEMGEVTEFNRGMRSCILIGKNSLHKVFRAHRTLELRNSVLVSEVEGHERRFAQFQEYRATRGLQVAIGLTLGYPPKCVEWFDLPEHDRRVKVYTGSVGSLHFVFPENLMNYVREYFAPKEVSIKWWENYSYRGAGTYLFTRKHMAVWETNSDNKEDC